MSKEQEQSLGLGAWKKKYYPLPADDIRATQSPLSAIQHSLRKWIGLRPETRREYRLYYCGCNIAGDSVPEEPPQVMTIKSDTCSLCQYGLKYSYYPCTPCPINLFKMEKGPIPVIEKYREREACGREYAAFTWGGDPSPMIRLLYQVQRWQIAKMEAEGKPTTELVEGTLRKSPQEKTFYLKGYKRNTQITVTAGLPGVLKEALELVEKEPQTRLFTLADSRIINIEPL